MLKFTKVVGIIILCMGVFVGCGSTQVHQDQNDSAIETPVEDTVNEDVDDKVVTESNEDFKNTLTSPWFGEESAVWYNENKDKELEINGTIVYFDKIPGKTSRYTMIIEPGDYNQNGNPGPSFLVRDFGLYKCRDLADSGNLKVGTNIKVRLSNHGYYAKSDAIWVDILSIEAR